MNRREFITLLGGAAVAWPLAARAQQREPMRRIGVLMGFAESDQNWQARLTALRTVLQERGWTDGRNIRFDVRWTPPNPDRLAATPIRAIAADLVAQAPDVLIACPYFAVAALHEQNHSIPVVAIQSGDLVTAGLTQSHARPGGNITGFTSFEPSINTKFLQLLKDISPPMNRVAIIQSQARYGAATSPRLKASLVHLVCSRAIPSSATRAISRMLSQHSHVNRMAG